MHGCVCSRSPMGGWRVVVRSSTHPDRCRAQRARCAPILLLHRWWTLSSPGHPAPFPPSSTQAQTILGRRAPRTLKAHPRPHLCLPPSFHRRNSAVALAPTQPPCVFHTPLLQSTPHPLPPEQKTIDNLEKEVGRRASHAAELQSRLHVARSRSAVLEQHLLAIGGRTEHGRWEGAGEGCFWM